MTSAERPIARPRPRPAADEATDPVVPSGRFDRPAEAALAPVARRGPEPTVQLNVRVAAGIADIIEARMTKTGKTKRQLVEDAIRQTYS